MLHFQASTMIRGVDGDGGEDHDNNISSTTHMHDLHKSCDRCSLKKRKCDGGNPCRRCVRIGDPCTYSKRRSRVIKPQPPVPDYAGSANDSRKLAPTPLLGGPGVSAALQQYGGTVSLKRCRLSPSPATGLVGMQENMFLSDYFGCIGFLPFTSQSNIRETMVKLFAGSAGIQHFDPGDYTTTEQHFDSIVPGGNQLPVEPSTCVFWCAVALGSLVKGRPIESVAKYTRLARNALVNVSGPPTADMARAWAILAYMSDFCGDTVGFHAWVQQANDVLEDLGEEGNSALPVGLSEVVKHGETIKIFIGDVDSEELASFCSQERAIPQINEAATEGEICQFVMQSYRLFEQTLYEKVNEHRSTPRRLDGDIENFEGSSSAEPVDARLSPKSSAHFIATLIREQEEGAVGPGILETMMVMLKQHSHQFHRLEYAADRPNIRGGIGGIIINGTLVFGKVAKKDFRGALENLEVCGEVFERYPGLCRFSMGSHIMHMLLANLVVVADPRTRGIYGKMRTAYNSALLPGARAIPPFEEWHGVADFCDNYNCRFMEFMANIERADASSSASPHKHAPEMMQEAKIPDVPVDDRQQRGGSSATVSQRETKDDIADEVMHHRVRTVNASISKPAPERVSDQELYGCIGNISWDARPTVLTPLLEPISTTHLLRRFGSDPIDDSDVGPAVDARSNYDGRTGLVSQAAEEMLSPAFGRDQTMIVDETARESIGVADWLDVTHAMLDTSDLATDL